MAMRKIELWHNTDEQVCEFIEKGLDLVDAFDPPDDLRGHVFNQAVALYSGRAIQFEQVGIGGLAIPRNNSL